MADRDSVVDARLLALEQAIARVKSDNPGHLNNADMVSIRDYFDTRLIAIEQATGIAAASMEKRLNGMNEFRDTLRDQASRFVTRQEMDSQFAIVNVTLGELRTFKDRMQGKASAGSVYLAWALSGIGLIIGMVGLFV